MEHYALVGNKTCGVSVMAAAAYRKEEYPRGRVCDGEGRTWEVLGGQGEGRNKFSRQMNSHLALLSAQKATETRAGTVKRSFLFGVYSLERTKADAEVTRQIIVAAQR